MAVLTCGACYNGGQEHACVALRNLSVNDINESKVVPPYHSTPKLACFPAKLARFPASLPRN
eukprot:2088115-Rhodomonas_salina.1